MTTKKQQRKDMLKKYEGKLSGPYDHLKEGVDYLDDIQKNKKITTKTSFGEYFDIQRDKIVKDMQNKNKQQNVEWMEGYEKRQGMAEKRKKEIRYKKELLECSDKGIEISEECKTYFKNQFETNNAQI